jgi:hypothetical protein
MRQRINSFSYGQQTAKYKAATTPVAKIDILCGRPIMSGFPGRMSAGIDPENE